MDWTFFVKRNSRVESTIGAHHIQRSLSIIALAGLIRFGLCQNDHSCTQLIPLERDFVALVKGLLRNRRVELRNIENLDSGWLTLKKIRFSIRCKRVPYLALRDKYSHGVVIARREGEIGHALSTQLVPNRAEI